MAELPKWEYRVQTFGGALGGPKDDALTMVLDEWGEQGWEVIGWALQYDKDMRPAKARNYEPAAVSVGQTLECIRNLEIFYKITGDRDYLRGIPDAIRWLERSTLNGGRGAVLLGFLGQLRRSKTTVPLTRPDTSFYGGNFGFRRSVCEVIGDFDAELGRKGSDNTGGEEVDFYRRLLRHGFNVWWTPDATIYHRIQVDKLKRSYFLGLHYRQGRMEGLRKRGRASRMPPLYLYPQLGRSVAALLRQWRSAGRRATVRAEMNVSYFVGYILGWAFGGQPSGVDGAVHSPGGGPSGPGFR